MNEKAKKKKILHLVEALGGGVFSFLVDLINQTDQDYDITIAYGIRNETAKNFKEYFTGRVRFIEVKNFTRNLNPRKDFSAVRELKKIIKEIKPDIIHMHSSKAGAIGRLAVTPKGKKLIYNPHGFSFLKQDDLKLKRFIYKSIEKLLTIRKCTIVGCSKGEYEQARKISKNSVCINNGINTEKLKEEINNLQQRDIDYEKLKICTVGRITYQKNPNLYNEIAHSFPNIKFTWIGEGELAGKLEAENITVTGWLERKEVLKLLNENDIFILTSLWEGLPIALLEAMYLKKVCIVSNVIGNKDVIINGENGFICNKIEEYKNIINKIKNKEYELNQIRDNAKIEIEKKYNIEQMSKEYIKLYEK